MPPTAITVPAGTSKFWSGYFIDNRPPDLLPMDPDPGGLKIISLVVFGVDID